MKKALDFIAEHQEEMRMLNESGGTTLSKSDWQWFELTSKLAEAHESQFQKIKNTDKCRQLEDVFFPLLVKIAEIQGGRVDLAIHEKTLLGELSYIGNDLILNNTFCTDLKDFSHMVSVADDIYVSTEDGYFKFQFMFHLYDKLQVADHSKEILEIKEKIRFRQCEKDTKIFEESGLKNQ